MSTCAVPLTLSPGFMFLRYVHTTQSLTHKTHVRLQYGVDPGDNSLMLLTATEWAEALQRVLTVNFAIVSYGIQRLDGSLVYENGFTALVGNHAAASGALDYKSRTLCITGHGVPPAAADCSGEARTTMFVGGAFEFIAGQKWMVSGTDSNVDDLAAFLSGSPIVWADYYGHEANARGQFPVQFNARTQRKYGT